MSDSGLSSVNIPTDVEYEQSLKRAVRNGLKAAEEVSVNIARERAEKELGLDAGFFKNDPVWKGKSKNIVQAAFEDPQSSPEKPKPKAKPVVTKAKTGTKRKSSNVPAASNKRTKKGAKTVPDSDVSSELSNSEAEDTKKQADDEDVSDFGDSDGDETPKAGAKKAKSKPAPKSKAKAVAKRKPAGKKVKDESELSSETEGEAKIAPKATKKKAVKSNKSQDAVVSDSEDEEANAAPKSTKDESELSDAPDSKNDEPSNTDSKPPTAEDDESDMSVLIDDPPPKKKRASNGTSKAKATKTSKPAASKKKGPELTPNEEEIKRLQGWLVKCGVRKMWHNELKGCDTEKDKIKHLKKMLEDIGMTGRYSNEKAKEIREARELAAELEETQQYAAKWGSKDDKEDGSDDGEGSGSDEAESKPAAAAPRKPKGFVDFGDSGDETD